MSGKKKIKVVQGDVEVPLEVMAESIRDISRGIRVLTNGPLNKKAILLLIQHSAPTKGYGGGRYGLVEIQDILDGIEGLEKAYLKPKGKLNERNQ